MRATDTTRSSARHQADLYRSLRPERRVALAATMSDEIWVVAAAGIRDRHPAYDEEMVAWALRRLRVGDTLFWLVWPGAPLVEP